jgi:hypothetical protein
MQRSPRMSRQLGYRYRLYDSFLPGRPGLVFKAHRKAIFVHGYFWHGHRSRKCKRARMLKRNLEYWSEKIRSSQRVDIYSTPLSVDWQMRLEACLYTGCRRPAHGSVVARARSWPPSPLQDVDDPLRTELETPIAADVPIFPVLVRGATMPKAADLPGSLKEVSDINAAIVDTGRDFDLHVARLIDSLTAGSPRDDHPPNRLH